jgi:hypothetical protein
MTITHTQLTTESCSQEEDLLMISSFFSERVQHSILIVDPLRQGNGHLFYIHEERRTRKDQQKSFIIIQCEAQIIVIYYYMAA